MPGIPAAAPARDTSGLTTHLVLAFVEHERGPAGVRELLARAGLPHTEAQLRDDERWFDWETKIRLFDALCAVLGDPRAGLRLGAAVIDLNVGAGVKLAARAIGDPRLLYLNTPRLAAKFCSTHRFDVVESGRAHAVLRHRDVSGVGHHRCDCDYNTGLLTAAPELFGLPTARVQHVECALDGAPACVYRVAFVRRWGAQRVQVSVGAAVAAGTSVATLAGPELLPVTAGALVAGSVLVARRAVAGQRRRLRRLRGQVAEQGLAADRTAAALHDLSAAVGIDQMLDRIARGAQAAVGGRDFAVLLQDPGSGARSRASAGVPGAVVDGLAGWLALAAPAGDATALLLGDEPVLVGDAAKVPALAGMAAAGFGSLCAAPLRFRDEPLGALVALAPGTDAFLPYDADLLGAHASQAAVAFANARLVGRLEQLATRDPLTGLANEQGLAEAIERDLAGHADHRAPSALAMLRLDDFAGTVDRAAADGALRAAAQAIAAGAPAPRVAARLAGSRFAVLLPGAALDAAAAEVEALRAAVARATGFGCSAGLSGHPAHASTVAGLFETADGALERATGAAAGTTVRYDPAHVATESGAAARAEVEALLADPARLTCVFQPIVRVAGERIAGFEALSRFAGGDRRPDEWFALAHRAGLGPQLEALAIERALAVPGRPDGTYLSVNASPSGLASEAVWAVLPCDLRGIVVEVTEQEAFGAGRELDEALERVRARGGRIALDDAGSGYAGLQQVVRVAPDVLKVDRSLVAGVHHDAARRSLLEALAAFAANTGCEVCAEGVEEQAELDVLRELGIALAQGYLLARPQAPWATLTVPAALAA